MSIKPTPDQRRYDAREAIYANSAEEAAAVEAVDREEFNRVRPLDDFLTQAARALTAEADEAAVNAGGLYGEARAFALNVRSGEVEADAFAAREAEAYRGQILLAVRELRQYASRLEHSASKVGDVYAAYSDILARFPSVRRT